MVAILFKYTTIIQVFGGPDLGLPISPPICTLMGSSFLQN